MAETTNISWCDSTLNFWIGCQETGSPACVPCYARERSLRYAPKGTDPATVWGPHGARVETKSWRTNLRKISRLALAAFAAGRTEPWLVFVNSLSDFFDNQADPDLRAAAFQAMRDHPHLTFILLTKRPQMIERLWFKSDGSNAFPKNVILMCTVVTQEEADRDIPHLVAAATAFGVRAGLSMEPLAEAVDISEWLFRFKSCDDCPCPDPATSREGFEECCRDPEMIDPSVCWVITGGGTDQGKHKAAPSNPQWFRDIRDQCDAADVAFHHKQNGEFAEVKNRSVSLLEAGVHIQPWGYAGPWMQRVGKKRAGRLLDGVIHDARPTTT